MPSRREFVGSLGAVVLAGIAGCLSTDRGRDATVDPTAVTPSDRTGTPTLTPTSTLTPTRTRTSTGRDSRQSTTATTRTRTTAATPRAVQASAQGATEFLPGTGKQFGRSVALSTDGTTCLVADPGANDGRGVAHLFARSDEGWRHETTFAPGVGEGGNFGSDVALSGDGTTALVGISEDGSNGAGSGSAWVLVDGDGSWRREATLLPNDGDSRDGFGDAVALSYDGTTAAVSASTDEDPNGAAAGSAYVFDRSSGGWRQRANVAASDGDRVDGFGYDVSLSNDGTTALVGAGLDDGGGSAYVFSLSDGEWRQRTKLTAGDRDSRDAFGSSVALSGTGTTAVVGAQLDEHPNGHHAGASYVFSRSAAGWRQQAKLLPDDGGAEDHFGSSVAVSDDARVALVGAGGEGGSAVYAYARTADGWQQRIRLVPVDGGFVPTFGHSVDLSGDATTALVGAWDAGSNDRGGSAYAYEL